MANSKGRRRRFGSIRRLPSGRYQARYPGPDGVDRPADDTFTTRADAEDWLTLKEAEILEDDWIDPDAGNVFVPAYVETWIGEITALRPKTVKIYRGLLRSHIAPHLATVTVGEMTLARVRRWRKKLIDSGVSAITVAKAYRLLRAVFNTAVDDEMIKRNPCRIKGAGNEDSPERPVLVGLRYRSLILLAAFTSLRWAELAALTPADIDLAREPSG
jgi:integrase